jgi:hypothetical protein
METHVPLRTFIDINSTNNIYTANARLLERWTRNIEYMIPLYPGCTVYVGWRLLSHGVPMLEVYERLAQDAKVHIFAYTDIQANMPDSVQYISLSPESMLTRQRFLVAHCENYAQALIARDLDSGDLSAPTGVLTSDRRSVQRMAAYLHQLARKG